MFSDLRKFLTRSYFDSHKKIIIYTEKKKLVYEAFSVYKTMEDSDAYDVRFSTDDEFYNHINMLINNSAIEFTGDGMDIQKIITLSTCTNNIEGERVVVIAKLVEEVENSIDKNID